MQYFVSVSDTPCVLRTTILAIFGFWTASEKRVEAPWSTAGRTNEQRACRHHKLVEGCDYSACTPLGNLNPKKHDYLSSEKVSFAICRLWSPPGRDISWLLQRGRHSEKSSPSRCVKLAQK